MARGKLRIRQRGSRQQWAQARTFKEFSGAEGEPGVEAADGPPKPPPGDDLIASTRCGLCGVVVEQRLRDRKRVVLLPHALCISCDEVRCEDCWLAEEDRCGVDDEHEFLEVHYAEGGAAQVADFGSWIG